MTGDCRYCDQGYPLEGAMHSGARGVFQVRFNGPPTIGPTPCENLDLLEPAVRVVRAFLDSKSRSITGDLRKALETVLMVAEEDERELERLRAGIRQVHHDVDEGLLRLIEEWPSA